MRRRHIDRTETDATTGSESSSRGGMNRSTAGEAIVEAFGAAAIVEGVQLGFIRIRHDVESR